MHPTNEELSELFTNIEKTNAAFLAADPPTKRVMLAKDVLAQLKINRFHAASTYFFPQRIDASGEQFYDDMFLPPYDKDTELQSALRNLPLCEVCGIGSLFVSAVQRLDKMKMSEYFDHRQIMTQYLSGFELFSYKELDEIERFFENSFGESLSNSKCNFLTYKFRLIRIAEFIIETEGRQEITRPLLAAKVPPVEQLMLGETSEQK